MTFPDSRRHSVPLQQQLWLRMLWRVVRRCLASLGLAMLAITLLPIDGFWLNHMVGPWNDPKGDILIVLGGDSLGDMIGAASYLRSVYATRVWHEGGFRQIVISGGTANGGPRVSEQMRDFLVCQGVPANAIVLESQSQDTHQN